MSNRPEMSREDALNSKCAMWKIQINRGADDRAQATLDEIHLLQWQIAQGHRDGVR